MERSTQESVGLADDDPRVAAASAMRWLGHAMVAFQADDDLLRRIAAQAEATAEVVEAGVRRQRPVVDLKRRMWETVPTTRGARMAHFEECVVSGRANPMGVAMVVRRDDEQVEAEVHLGAAFEGAPRRAHGGIVAAILDDIMGYVLLVLGTPAFTGQLDVTYLAPTPVETDLVARARLDRREGRKLWMIGELSTADGTPIARSAGLFIIVDPERFRGPQDDVG